MFKCAANIFEIYGCFEGTWIQSIGSKTKASSQILLENASSTSHLYLVGIRALKEVYRMETVSNNSYSSKENVYPCCAFLKCLYVGVTFLPKCIGTKIFNVFKDLKKSTHVELYFRPELWSSEIAGEGCASRVNIINATPCVLRLSNCIEHQTFGSNSIASKTWPRRMWSKASERHPIMSSANSSRAWLSFLLYLRGLKAVHGCQMWISCGLWVHVN